MTPESPKWNAIPEALRIEADVERIGGHHAQAAFIDACASAWKADRKRLATVVAMCEEPISRGQMTPRQCAFLLDTIRAAALAAKQSR